MVALASDRGRVFTLASAAEVRELELRMPVVAPELERLDNVGHWEFRFSPGTISIGTVKRHRLFPGFQAHPDYQGESTRLGGPTPRWGSVRGDNGGVSTAPLDDGPKRGRVTEWSGKSRARLQKVLSSLDYTPMMADGAIPVLVTLTLPANWEASAPTAERYSYLIRRFRMEFLRAWGIPVVGPWKREFQERGAPHTHMLIIPPKGRSRGRGLTFQEWLSETWARICLPPGFDLRDDLQNKRYRDHVAAGTRVDFDHGLRGTDPRRIAVYFAKHASFGAKEYQNEPPQLWKDSGGVGLFWGYWVLKKAQGVIPLAIVRRSADDPESIMSRNRNQADSAETMTGRVPFT